MAEDPSEKTPLTNGVKVLAEAAVLPGFSLLMDGEVKTGAIHAVAGLAARVLIGPIGWGLVAANSFSNSVSNKHLHQHFLPAESAAPVTVDASSEAAEAA